MADGIGNHIAQQLFDFHKTGIEKQYNTSSYFDVRSKADISQLKLPHERKKIFKECKRQKLKSKTRICSEISVNSLTPWSQSRREKEVYGGNDLRKKKVSSLQ